MTLRRTSTSLAGLIRAPLAGSMRGAVCLTCGRLVDEEVRVEGCPGVTTTAKFLVRHHGAEELRSYDLGSTDWDDSDLAALVQKTSWFDPTADGMGLGIRVENVGEHDDKDAFQPYSFGSKNK